MTPRNGKNTFFRKFFDIRRKVSERRMFKYNGIKSKKDMKRLNKLFIIAACSLGTISLTSCLGDDDNGSGITDEVYESYLANISGIFYGNGTDWRYENKIYFFNEDLEGTTVDEKTDSVKIQTVEFSKRDTTFTIHGVPTKVLAKEISDSNKDLKEAIENVGTTDITGKFDFYNIGNVASYFVWPSPVTFSNLTYGGKSHEVKILFFAPSAGVYGYTTGNRYQAVNFSLSVGAIYVDGAPKETIYNGSGTQLDELKSILTVSATR